MKAAWKFTVWGQASRMVEVPNSFQGIELSNASSEVYSIYVTSGNEIDDGTDRIYRLNSNGVLKYAGKIIHSDFHPGVNYEIEGVKIEGDNLLFSLVQSGKGVDKTKPFIMKIAKSLLQ